MFGTISISNINLLLDVLDCKNNDKIMVCFLNISYGVRYHLTNLKIKINLNMEKKEKILKSKSSQLTQFRE